MTKPTQLMFGDLLRDSVSKVAVSALICALTIELASASGAQDLGLDPQPGPGEPRVLDKQEVAAGWLNLFDGQTLYGWRNEGDANFDVVDGKITADQGSAPCLLRTTSQFDDFELLVDFRISAATNSGIFVRSAPRPTDPTLDCYEINLAQPSVSPFPTGSVVGRQANPLEIDVEHWHRLHLRIVAGHLQVSVDGKPITDLDGQLPTGRGYVGLQFNAGPVAFCNVFLRPLMSESLKPRDLSKWRIGPQADSLSVAADSERTFTLENGVGYVESREQFDDFVLRIAVFTHAAGVNSGLFFRCVPGSNLDGYESQIHNLMEDSDPTRPIDHGTGGIFRRIPARRIWAEDQRWFTMTIVAEGNHIDVWVEGQRVVEWSDTRAENANPRRGRRLDAGTLALQLHDAGSAVSFRELYVRPLETRRK